jgi:hypothetical protein
MECCDVETIGTLTGVLAHFRYYRRGLRKENRRGIEMQWWGLAWEAVLGG